MSDPPKWSCDYCTYENYPTAVKCTMCHGARPRVTEDIYKVEGAAKASGGSTPERWSCESCSCRNTAWSKECSACLRPAPSTQSPPSHRPLRISDSSDSPQPPKPLKWSCSACTYDNWPKAKKCVMCGTSLSNSPAHSAVNKSPDRELTPNRINFDENSSNTLNKRFKREELLATLVAQLESGGGGALKRVPSYVAPELAQAIRRHAATLLTNGKLSHSLYCPYLTEFNTFYLPYDIVELPGFIQEQVFSELLDRDVQGQLEEGIPPVINWSVEVTVTLGSRLYALWNRSQGDCLLDSLMQAMWGVFDRDGLLRRALSDTMHHTAHVMYPRWVESESAQARQLDFSLSDAQWAEDWAALVARAAQPGAALQQLHVFALAHVLRRPIVVYGVKVVKSFRGEDLGYAGFEGIYLPLLWEPGFCSTSPVCLGYTRGHFSALVGVEPRRSHGDQLVTFLPLVDSDRKLLPIHFLTKAEMSCSERLLREWLDVNVTDTGLLVTRQTCEERPLLVAQMLEEWLNHYRSIAQMSATPHLHAVPTQDFSSDGDSDDE